MKQIINTYLFLILPILGLAQGKEQVWDQQIGNIYLRG